jgi:hypothetical protein
MNKDIMRACGFGKEVAAVDAGKCPMCGNPVHTDDFVDELSVREFRISGLCQSCQNDVFNAEEPEDYDEDEPEPPECPEPEPEPVEEDLHNDYE